MHNRCYRRRRSTLPSRRTLERGGGEDEGAPRCAFESRGSRCVRYRSDYCADFSFLPLYEDIGEVR